MCGIIAVFNAKLHGEELRKQILQLSSRIRHRGPDWSGAKVIGHNALAHERLAIVDVDNGAQPLTDETSRIILSVNGEIYNHKKLQGDLMQPYRFLTKSDCECIIPLWLQSKGNPEHFLNLLDGMFSFVIYDRNTDEYLVVRDPIGITSLYQGWDKDGSRWFASEMKCLVDHCERIEVFPPGCYLHSKTGNIRKYYDPFWAKPGYVPTTPVDLTKLRECVEAAVTKRLMCDVPYGVLLSGGLDSSLVASIASRQSRKRIEDEGKTEAWWPRLHSFSIGLDGAPDLAAARKVASFIDSQHHEYTFTIQDGLDAIRNIIFHLETYDTTTIRASTPMYLLSRKIKASGVKMVMSGEGADEVFAGYLYFHRAPSSAELHRETVQRVQQLHTADCLRANKSTMAWGLEARVPFLDLDLLDLSMNIEPSQKMHGNGVMEKYILRKAFDTPDRPYLPDEVLWRQKEQFSDGVGYSWIDSLKEYTASHVSDEQLENASKRFPFDTPRTKEAYYYRCIFEELFHSQTAATTVVNWIPKEEWGCNADPSGRAQGVHLAAYESQ